jgi:cytochrome c oxidase cbb3-type subunit 3
MSPGWSAWVMFLVTLNLGITLFLFIWGMRVRIPVLPDGTSGHVWAHGVLREGVRPLPLWWVVTSAAVFAGAFGYLVLYPGFGAYKGLLGWDSQAELDRDTAHNRAEFERWSQHLYDQSVEQLARNQHALRLGHRLYLDNCAACHGREGQGNSALPAPRLNDRDWLYGGDGNAIRTSILEGRRGLMPPMGGAMDEATITRVAHYVLSLSGAAHDPAQASAGKPHFVVCAACHGIEGKGNIAMGAPNLTDAIWLYGGTREDIETAIREGRSGLMPALKTRLSEPQAQLIAAWVYSLSLPAGKAGGAP